MCQKWCTDWGGTCHEMWEFIAIMLAPVTAARTKPISLPPYADS